MPGFDLRALLAGVWSWMEHHPWLGRALFIASLCVSLPLVALVLLPSVLGLFAPRLDSGLDLYSVNRPVAFTFLDVKGNEVGHRGAIVGDRLKISDMPAYVPAAFISMEDRSFYEHGGIDPKGLIRATISNLRAGHVVAGGSTITQQTAKIVFTNSERSYSRKLEELMQAVALEKSLSKEQILTVYLNRIYLGSGAYGVDGAARVYFGKSARKLTLPEAAMLATLTTAPSIFSPRRDLAKAQARATRVLNTMVETGAITRAEADDAIAHPAVITDRTITDARNYFLDTAADEARKLISTGEGSSTVDLVVKTTLEPKIQEAARKALVRTLNKRGKASRASEGAVVVMKPDGAVSALIGGKDYGESVFNRATQARRQPGSSFKPFVYLAAVENGISPWDMRDDGPVDIDGWAPTNYGGRQYGTLTLASALAHSVNTITASLAQEVGVTQVVEAAQRLGITSPLETNASIALGTSEVTPLEMTTAYAVFANGGLKVEPYFVTEVRDTGGHVLYKRRSPQERRVVASHVDQDMTYMLNQVMVEGTGRGAALATYQTAGKTGTTQDYHDAWFVGFTADYVAAVWVGNDDSSPMKGVTGGSLPAAIWKDTMTAAEKGHQPTALAMSTPPEILPQDGTIFLNSGVDTESGGVTVDGVDLDQSAQPQKPQRSRNFFDWLFGRGGDEESNDSAYDQQPERRDRFDHRSNSHDDEDDDSEAPRTRNYRWRDREDSRDGSSPD
ncbi:MAG: PBP1A family penicillin-binding protein [Alphaproteobacteria bacterium]|nr:PBP1A family penicillin-binding protein [Alphaproteobacteria bacterium]